MAIVRGPQGGHSNDGTGRIVTTVTECGPYADVLAAAKARPRGTLIADVGYVLQWSINRAPGGLGVVTYSCADQDAESHSTNASLSDHYSLRNVMISVPLMRYCGPSEVNNARWYDIRKWKQGTDMSKFNEYKWTDDGGKTWNELDARSKLLADKIKAGHEAVQRFYPVVTRTRVYSDEPNDDIGADLSYIDTPPKWDTAALAWLKVQDDVTMLSDGTWQRVEQWQGAEALDANFYGDSPSRWAFGTI